VPTVVSNPITETIEGVVISVNERGFKLEGRDSWLNLSKYASPAPELPFKDELVSAGLDKAGYVREIRIVEDSRGFPAGQKWEDTGPAEPTPIRAEVTPATGAPVTREMAIGRMAAINSAVAILSSGGRSTDVSTVLSVAAEIEGWVTR
jgi:hypothetical protein